MASESSDDAPPDAETVVQRDAQTTAGPGLAAVAPVAWSAETSSQPVVQHAGEPSILPKVLVALASGALLAVVTVGVLLFVPARHAPVASSPASPEKPAPPAPQTVVPAPTAPPVTVTEMLPAPATPPLGATEVSTAMTSRGRTGHAFEACYFIRDSNGYPVRDPEQPYALGLVGTPPQWADITDKLHALGIDIEIDTAGVVTNVTFANNQARRAWANWWAVAKCN